MTKDKRPTTLDSTRAGHSTDGIKCPWSFGVSLLWSLCWGTTRMPTVLVVDDSAVDRRLVGGLLGRGTMLTVETAENGAAALARLKQGLPDVVVTDLQMPEMDGLALIKTIRAHYSRVPVILMTARGSEELAVLFAELWLTESRNAITQGQKWGFRGGELALLLWGDVAA